MTDQELRDLVAYLAIDSQKIHEQMKQTDEQMKRTDERLERFMKRTDEQFRLTEEQFKRTDEQLERTDEQLKRTDEKLERTDEQLKRTDEKLERFMERTDEQFRLTEEQFKRTDEKLERFMERTDEQFRLTEEQFKRTDEQLKRTDEQLKRTDEKLERMGVLLGNMGKNQGDIAEEFFFHSLLKDNHLGEIYFDDITKNMCRARGGIEEEYDLVMTNGDSIGIVEVKYKANENDIKKLERKVKNFKKLFPIYQNYKLYGALASFHINDQIKHNLLEHGFLVLQRSGDIVQTDCGERLMIF